VKLTVWGEAGGPGTIAASRTRSGRVSGARSYDSLELALPTEGIEIDCDHDGRRVGELVHAQLDDDRLRVVAVLDDDWLGEVEEPVYFSPLLELRGRDLSGSTYIGRTAELLGLSLTFATARLGAHPLSMRAGDVRDSGDRFSHWPGLVRVPDAHRPAAVPPQRAEGVAVGTRRDRDRGVRAAHAPALVRLAPGGARRVGRDSRRARRTLPRHDVAGGLHAHARGPRSEAGGTAGGASRSNIGADTG
jgi:hypothetical protein